MSEFKPSKYQQAIFNFIEKSTGSAIVEAVAGSGKTTTIVQALRLIPASAKVVFLAFNKSIAMELQKRVPQNVEAKTLNALGHRALMRFFGNLRVQLDTNKTRAIIREALTEAEQQYEPAIRKLVSLAKANGLVPATVKGAVSLLPDTDTVWSELIDQFDVEIDDGNSSYSGEEDAPEVSGARELVIKCARRVLELSLSRRDIIDFDDQLYMTVALNAPMFRYDWVFVDEAQDVSPIQRALLRKALKPGGRLVAVGDSCQAIYGFRGADSNSMNRIAEEFGCARLPLSISYRCARSVVEFARAIVPHIEPSETAPQGEVTTMAAYDEKVFSQDDLIVCRNTKPIIGLAFALINRRVPVKVLGREIGTGLVSLVKKLKPRGMEDLQTKLDRWEAREIEKWTAKGKEEKAQAVEDKAATIRTFITETKSRTVPQFIEEIESFFSDDYGTRLTLATVHKAKGLEARRVFVLDPQLMPSKYARQDWQKQQEANIQYVAYTRAKETLVFIEGRNFGRSKAAEVA